MKKLLNFVKFFIPPARWRLPVLLALGIFTGTVLYLIPTSKALSYLSDKPETCINCHIMTPQYTTWKHSSHSRVTNCNDCHVPHTSTIDKYSFKARDGLRHSALFTLRKEREVIVIEPEGRAVVQQNCIRCHENQFHKSTENFRDTQTKAERTCWSCHREVPHGKVRSLSIAPFALTEEKP